MPVGRSPVPSSHQMEPRKTPVPSMCRSTGCARRSKRTRQTRFICKRCAGRAILFMSTEGRTVMSALTETGEKVEQHSLYWRFNRFLERYLPAGLYQRSLLIVVVPIVLMQSIMVGIILDRHWDSVTKVLARSLAREISLVIGLYDRSDKSPRAIEDLRKMTNDRL